MPIALTEPLSVSIRDAAKLTGIPQTELRRLIAGGDLPFVRWGKSRMLIPYQALKAFIQEHEYREALISATVAGLQANIR